MQGAASSQVDFAWRELGICLCWIHLLRMHALPAPDTAINIQKAKMHLSTLVEHVSADDSVVVTKAGTALVRTLAVDAPPSPKRFGFMELQGKVPDDFDQMAQAEIEALFYDKA